MPEVKPTDTRDRAATNLEQISSWLTVLIALMGLGSSAYALISLGSHELSRPLFIALALTFVSFITAFLGGWLQFHFLRQALKSAEQELRRELENFTVQQRDSQEQLNLSVDQILTARDTLSDDVIHSLVEQSVRRSFDTLRQPPVKPPRVTGPIRTYDSAPPEPIDHTRAPATDDNDPRDLLEQLAERDEMAREASLALSVEVTRAQPPNACEYRVWFGTDRRPNVEGDYSQGFKEEFADRLHHGSCVVRIPKSHEFASLGSHPIMRIFKRVTGQPADEKLKLLAIETGTKESFVNDLRESLRALKQSERDLVLFVHGYNVDFESAALRTAQIGRDLELPGPMLFYSWPSKASLSGYGADEETIGRTLPKFVRFLQLLISIPELGAVNVIAHSMGNRLFQRAMQLFAFREQASDRRFGHVVLAAPDIDRETFRQAAQDYARLKANSERRTAVYFNKSDVAVGLSRWIHQEARAGTQGAAFANTDSILWVDSLFRLDWLGHGYFASAAPVLKDMKALLLENKTPTQRHPPLTPVPSDVPQYWELRG
jgi:esterase/lipase superfamily enzyme